MSVTDRLDEIEARANAATPGAWSVLDDGPADGYAGSIVTDHENVDHPVLADGAWLPNAEFIAHAREDVPALVAALRAVLDREALAAALFEFEGIGLEWSGPIAEGTYAPKSAVGRAYARADVIIAHVESALGGA